MVIKVEEDDHGHATLLVHGEPEIIQVLAASVALLLADGAEDIALIDPEELEAVRIVEDDEEDIASTS